MSAKGRGGATPKKLVKSPLNYIGGKFKLLPQILPLFPKDIDTFIDVFGGGFNVGINVEANKIIYNDSISQVKDIMEWIKNEDTHKAISDIDNIVRKYNLHRYKPYELFSKEETETYKQNHVKMRNDYNSNKTPLMLYALICVSFSNQIRFNSKGDYNVPSGKRYFNTALKKRFEDFSDTLKLKNVDFLNEDYSFVQELSLTPNSLLYFDPPYLDTTATYNENGGWSESDEINLHKLLDSLNQKGYRFALSNVIENKGKENTLLKMWSLKYNVHYLNHSYGNCNYHTKDKSKNSTTEVLITNY